MKETHVDCTFDYWLWLMHISGSNTDSWCNQTYKSAIEKDSAVVESYKGLTSLVIDVYFYNWSC
jgi:hypothetical protein